ncbi:MAG: hypothetical protein SOY73_00005 [Blautia sp.]|nr:hypothetical protein [Blautia sp.]MDY3997496.1 hypothetical protein [Blautia sp.]
MKNHMLLDSINRALRFNGSGECFIILPIPFCELHVKVTEKIKIYELYFYGLIDWGYEMKVPLEKIDYDYILDSIEKNLKIFMQNYAEYLIKTELEVEG